MMKVLIAEDDKDNASLLKHILEKGSYAVQLVENGSDAYTRLQEDQFDVLLTDWMMPGIDGVELIRRVRSEFKTPMFVVMVTAISDLEIRNKAFCAGADDYIVKPFKVSNVLKCLEDGLSRLNQPAPKPSVVPYPEPASRPPFVGVVVAAGTGGPSTLLAFFNTLPTLAGASYLVVQHGPVWMLETFSQQSKRDTGLRFHLAQNGMVAQEGEIYLAPGENHLLVAGDNAMLRMDDGPRENFVRPAADRLFSSAAEVFGQYCVGVILTGMGRDGTLGAARIKSAGGSILVQDPQSATVESMPRTVIEVGLADEVVPLKKLGEAVFDQVTRLSTNLRESGNNSPG